MEQWKGLRDPSVLSIEFLARGIGFGEEEEEEEGGLQRGRGGVGLFPPLRVQQRHQQR